MRRARRHSVDIEGCGATTGHQRQMRPYAGHARYGANEGFGVSNITKPITARIYIYGRAVTIKSIPNDQGITAGGAGRHGPTLDSPIVQQVKGRVVGVPPPVQSETERAARDAGARRIGRPSPQHRQIRAANEIDSRAVRRVAGDRARIVFATAVVSQRRNRSRSGVSQQQTASHQPKQAN